MLLMRRTNRRDRQERWRTRLQVERLEARSLLSQLPVTTVAPGATLDQAGNLGDLSLTHLAETPGTIGKGPAGPADVNWYSFSLDAPAWVTLSAAKQQAGSSFNSVLSLYNTDPFDFSDPYDPLGHRLLAQDNAANHGGIAAIDRSLAAGTYFVAVSGDGNSYFCPFLAGSGMAGSTGDYDLRLTATDLKLDPANGPVVLATDPAPGAVLSSAPLELYIDLSAPLDPTTIVPGQTFNLTYSPSGTFGGSETSVPLAGYSFSTQADELRLTPASPLAPGAYRLVVAGAGVAGRDYMSTFRIDGIEGTVGPSAASDDTAATAHELGDITTAGLVQAGGTIGADPFCDFTSFDPTRNPANDVNLYHFHISGSGPYLFAAEVFAGRIGSPLDSGVSLYKLDPASGQLRFIDGNNNTYNNTPATDGSTPLASDSLLYANVTEGDYYVAVSSGANTPSPTENQLPGYGIFDPNVSHSGQTGWTTGPYVLNLLVSPFPQPPHVVATTPAEGAVLTAPPSQLTVQFDEPVNLQPLAFKAFQQNNQQTLSAVFVQGADGTRYFPRLQSYDPTTNQATFLMLDGLANGTYALHLSGANGLADFGGNPLVGNDPSGDFVTHFTVDGPVRGQPGNPLSWFDNASHTTFSQPQDLGVLFPHELQAGVTITHAFTQDPGKAAKGQAAFYRIQVLQTQTYFLNLSSIGTPANLQITLTDANGNPAPHQVVLDNGRSIIASLDPGTYIIEIAGWPPAQAVDIRYQLQLQLVGVNENPQPLLAGPTSALQLRLSGGITTDPASPVLSVSPLSSGSTESPAKSASSLPAIVASLPSGTLLELGSGPLGGAHGEGTPDLMPTTDRLALRSTDRLLRDALLQTIVLTPPAEESGDVVSSLLSSLAAPVTGTVMEQLRKAAVDVLSSQTEWLTVDFAPPAPEAPQVAIAHAEQMNVADPACAAVAPTKPARRTQHAAIAADWIGAGLLVVAIFSAAYLRGAPVLSRPALRREEDVALPAQA
jgi:methionine-rich copper-binding protein CopC